MHETRLVPWLMALMVGGCSATPFSSSGVRADGGVDGSPDVTSTPDDGGTEGGGTTQPGVGLDCDFGADTIRCATTSEVTKYRVSCVDKKTVAAPACAADQNCDKDGTCKSIVSSCQGKKGGESTCQDGKRVICGPDLVSVREDPCPTDTPTCVNGECSVCEANTKKCDGTSVLLCEGGKEWKKVSTCVDYCSKGECTDKCEAGTKRCSGKVLEQCSASGTFATLETCTDSCVDGACTSKECTPGEKSCADKVPRTCSAAGRWESHTACSTLCEQGLCKEKCTPKAVQCHDGKSKVTCDATGAWGAPEACAGACAAGECVECTQGARRCEGTTPQRCEAGKWKAQTACTTTCANGECTVCRPSSVRCSSSDGKTVETCSADGKSWTKGTVCPFQCQDGACAGQCATGDTRCDGLAVQVCEAGAWKSTTTCQYVCTASGGKASCGGACNKGETQCVAGSQKTCSDTNEWPATSTPCVATPSTCVGSVFRSYTVGCSQDAKTCTSTPYDQTCSAPSPVCDKGTLTTYVGAGCTSSGCSSGQASATACSVPSPICDGSNNYVSYASECQSSSACNPGGKAVVTPCQSTTTCIDGFTLQTTPSFGCDVSQGGCKFGSPSNTLCEGNFCDGSTLRTRTGCSGGACTSVLSDECSGSSCLDATTELTKTGCSAGACSTTQGACQMGYYCSGDDLYKGNGCVGTKCNTSYMQTCSPGKCYNSQCN